MLDDNGRAAFIMSQTACMMAEMNGMIAENQYREQCGNSVAYGLEAFNLLPSKYGIEHNQVVEFLRAGK